MKQGILTLEFANNFGEFGRAADDLRAFLMGCDVDESVISHIELSVEELVSNTISYGYGDGRTGRIEISVKVDDPISIVLADDGDIFDPFTLATPDLDATLDARAVGGLGVFFVTQFMDAYEYTTASARNLVRLEKSAMPRSPRASS
jgi:serine/threonine-protein kinase RsbW